MVQIVDINQLDPHKVYSYADYLLWHFQERVELFRGKILKMSPAPSRLHQKVMQNINIRLYHFFENKSCELYIAPFDVRLPSKKQTADSEILTVVQPDLCVICDQNKLDDRGAIGAPDLVVEILSPGNSKKEMDTKFDLYQEAGVREYWLVYPSEKAVNIYILDNQKFIGLKPFTAGQMISSTIFPNLKIAIDDIFLV